MDLQCDLDPFQNVMCCSLARATPCHQDSIKITPLGFAKSCSHSDRNKSHSEHHRLAEVLITAAEPAVIILLIMIWKVKRIQ